eukprot:m.250682 g.250682  ORF g.250682 m.250682 type:complete len:89 (+) comp40324_c2_seq12:166-432(+)
MKMTWKGAANCCELDEKDSEGLTAFLHAVWQGSDEVLKVRALLLRGADRTIPDKLGSTALIYALLCERKVCFTATVWKGRRYSFSVFR